MPSVLTQWRTWNFGQPDPVYNSAALTVDSMDKLSPATYSPDQSASVFPSGIYHGNFVWYEDPDGE